MEYVADELMKYECLECNKEFIVSEDIAKTLGGDINCPYCASEWIEAVAGCNEETLQELGCFGIYHWEIEELEDTKVEENRQAWKTEENLNFEDVCRYKADSDKPRLDLVPPAIIEAVGIIRTYGNNKYEGDTYRLVEPYRYRAAMMRHLCEYLRDSKSVDSESKLPHLWHLACNIAFLCELEKEG